jgi:hypothetical protein
MESPIPITDPLTRAAGMTSTPSANSQPLTGTPKSAPEAAAVKSPGDSQLVPDCSAW